MWEWLWHLPVGFVESIGESLEPLEEAANKRVKLLRLPCGPVAEVKMKVTHLCLTLCDPMDYTVHGILQARILEWVALPFSRGLSQPRD